MKLTLALLALFPATLNAACPLTGTVNLNFDSVSVPAGTTVDATSYLNANGVTFTAITAGVTPTISGPSASAAVPSSQPNTFIVSAGASPVAVSYQLNFCATLSSLSFTRTGMSGQSIVPGDPSWTASALNAQGQVVSTVSEGFLSAPPAQRFTLSGSGITALRIDARNDIARTVFNDPPLDDLTVVGVAATASNISSLNPASIVAGSPGFALTVNGSGFGSDALVLWNGSALPTTFVSSTQLSATVNSNLVAAPGSGTVTVFTGGTTSNAQSFTITTISASLATTSLSPTSAAPGSPTFTLTVNGSGFASSAFVLWNGSALPTTFVNSSQLTATVSSSFLVSPGTVNVTVFSGGTTSNGQTFTVSSASLSVSSISPNTASPGGSSFTLTVNGSGFAPGAIVLWNGASLPTTYVNSAQLTATVSSNLIASGGSSTITVFSGGTSSNAQTFTIASQSLAISSLSPTSASPGSPAFTLTVNGSGFVSSAVVLWNGASLPTTFINSTQLNANVPASLITAAGSATITVFLGGSSSNSISFTIGATSLTISSLSPASAVPGGAAFTLTVNGSGFVNGAVVLWNGSFLPTTFVNSTQLTASVGANLIASAGTATITVLSGGTGSNAQSFIISSSSVTISSLSPGSVAPGSPAFTLTVSGSGFVNGAVVLWNGGFLTTTFVSSTQLTATVTSNLIASAGSATITVITGGGTSNAQTFLISSSSLTITSLSPNSTSPGGATFTLTVNGAGFANGALVLWNGAALPTTFISSNQLTATVNSNLIFSAGTVSVTVLSGGVSSNASSFTIGTASLNISSLSPSSAVPGSQTFTLTVNGSGFVSGAAVLWNGSALPTSFISSSQLIATVSANLVASSGSATVTVSNNGSISNSLAFTISQSQPGTCPLSGTVNVNFDSLSLPQFPATPTDATSYLNSNGITFSVITSGLFPVVYNATPSGTAGGQSPAVPSSAPNIFSVASNTGGSNLTAQSYQLNFCAQLTSISFTRTGILGSAGDAPWTATAFNSQGQIVATVSEGFLTAPPAQRYTLTGNGITSLRIDARNDLAQTTFATPPLDDLSVVANTSFSISSLSPASAIPGGNNFTLTVNGSGFANGAAVLWNGSALNTTFVSSTQLSAFVPAALISFATSASVSVLNPGGVSSNTVSFLISTSGGSGGLSISSLNPASAPAGGQAFSLTVNGSGFVSGATVQWNGSFLSTTFVSSTQLTASVPAGLIVSSGTASIIVVNPGSGTSGAVTFTIGGSGPSVASLNPNSAPAGAAAFTLTVNGAGFASGATVQWNSSFLSTTFINSTQVTASVPAGLIASPGTANVLVLNPAGSSSNSVPFTTSSSINTQYGGFAHIAAGQGWNTAVTLVNLANSSTSVRFRFWSDNGVPLNLTIAVGSTSPNPSNSQTGATLDQTIPAGGSFVFDLTSTANPVQVGWIELLAPQGSSLSGFAIFQYLDPTTSSQGTAPLTTSTSTSLVFPFDNTGPNTGIAIANQSGTATANLSIRILDTNGVLLTTDTFVLAPDGHSDFLVVTQYPSTKGKRGFIQVTNQSGTVLTGLGFLFNPIGTFTSIPVTFQ